MRRCGISSVADLHATLFCACGQSHTIILEVVQIAGLNEQGRYAGQVSINRRMTGITGIDRFTTGF